MKFKKYGGMQRPSTKKSCDCVVLVADETGGLKPRIAIWMPEDGFKDGFFAEPKVGGDAHSRWTSEILDPVVYYAELGNKIPEIDIETAFKE